MAYGLYIGQVDLGTTCSSGPQCFVSQQLAPVNMPVNPAAENAAALLTQTLLYFLSSINSTSLGEGVAATEFPTSGVSARWSGHSIVNPPEKQLRAVADKPDSSPKE